MNAVEWMKSKAQNVETLEDGTVTFVFQGNLPSRMSHEVKEAASLRRDRGTSVVYSANGDVYGWSATFPVSISSANYVQFIYNDYTIPAQNS